VRIPRLSAAARLGYLKLCRKSGVSSRARSRSSSPIAGAGIRASFSARDVRRRWCSRHFPRSFPGQAGEDIPTEISADLDRAADRHFDEFERDSCTRSHRDARGVQQVLTLPRIGLRINALPSRTMCRHGCR